MKDPRHDRDGDQQGTLTLTLLYHLTNQDAEHLTDSSVGLTVIEALPNLPDFRSPTGGKA